MKIRLADYVADFLTENGITDCFSVVGGGAMHLNDAFGHHKGLKVTYNHHEQACAMAAEAYARIENKPALVCVTTGPGATNAVTGVAGAYMDSIPMIVISGQARYSTTVYASGLNLRTRGIQEFDIIEPAKYMTKYCQLVEKPEDIRYCLEKAVSMAKTGRPGPCWLDIPLDVQGAIIETDELSGYIPEQASIKPDRTVFEEIINKVKTVKRPVLFVGNGVRLAGAHDAFIELVNKLNIPVVTGVSSIDAISTEHPLYVGRTGTTGDRAGNFAVQNSDLFISFGGRLGYFQTGFNTKLWARGAFKIINDIDQNELEKDTINADMKICCDALDLIGGLLENITDPIPPREDWNKQCRIWKEKYPVVLPKHYEDKKANIYAFYDVLTKKLSADDALVVSVGTSRVAGSQASYIHEGMRFITNPNMAAMGFCLPAAIGVCRARNNKRTFLVTGEGSFQMNIQELQTIIENKFPVVIFVMNNQGYHSIRMTQSNFFEPPMIGIGPESGDLSFPDLSKLAPAYGFDYYRIENNQEMPEKIDYILKNKQLCICEVMLSKEQITEPKVSSRRLENGQMVSASLEDMAPFLPREELKENMYIPVCEE